MPSVVRQPFRGDYWTLVVIGLLIAAGAAGLSLLARGVPNLFLEDDAYFYLQIAWNVGTGAGSTFDGLHVTNGYHLLWMGMLSVLASLASLSGAGKAGLLFAACAVALLIAVATVLTAFRGVWERLLALLIFLFCGITMETTLLGALLVVIVRVHLGELRPEPWVVALVAALVPLTRIDLVWAAPALALLAGRDAEKGRTSGLPLVHVLIGALIGAGVHLMCERVLFGTWTSVSSAIEASAIARRGPLRLLVANLSNQGNQLRYVVGACLAVVVLADCWRRGDRRTPLVLVIAFGPILGYLALGSLRDWYFLSGLLLGLLLASRAAARLRPRVWTAVTVSLSGLIAVAMAGYLMLAAPDIRATARFIHDANAVLEPGAVVYGVDGTGFVGWWFHAPVINGDGFVNSRDYFRRMQRGDLHTYLAENQVTHIVTNRPGGDDVLLSRSGVRVMRKDATAVASVDSARNRYVHYRLFRLRQPQ